MKGVKRNDSKIMTRQQ